MTHTSSFRFAPRPWVFLGVVTLCQFAAFLGMNVFGFALADYIGARIVDDPTAIALELIVRALGFPLFEIAKLGTLSLVPFMLVAAGNAVIWAAAALLILHARRKGKS